MGKGPMKIIAAAVAALTVLASTAQAQMRPREAPFSHFYLFGEYNYYTDSSHLRGGGGGLGWNFNRYLGLQAGGEALSASGVNSTVFYGEAKLSWPLMDSLSVYAAAGGVYADASAKVILLTAPPTIANISRSTTGYRIGLGTEYWFSRHWGLRAGWHQQNAGGVGSEIAGGIAFRF